MNIQMIQTRSWNPSKLRKPLFKPMMRALDWAELIQGALPQLAKDSRKLLSRISDGLSVFDLPSRGNKLLRSFTLAYAGETVGEKAVGSIGALKNSTSIAGVGAVAVEVMHEHGLFTLSPHQLLILNIFGFICSSVLVLKSLADLNKTFNVITQQELWCTEFNSNLLYLANKICRLTIGLIGMGFFLFGGELAAPYLLLGLSSFSLVLSLTRYYYRISV